MQYLNAIKRKAVLTNQKPTELLENYAKFRTLLSFKNFRFLNNGSSGELFVSTRILGTLPIQIPSAFIRMGKSNT
jgi:hypothetical protein